jgi:hypothetical protein
MAKDITNANGYPYGCEAASNPAMPSHDAHGDSRKKTKSDRKTEERQKQESGNNDDE